MRPNHLWALYFVYSPDGELNAAHQFTLARLREQGFAIALVIAAAQSHDIAVCATEMADWVAWKELPGYDFSAYALGLTMLARYSPKATVLVLNDSVLGPFGDVRSAVINAPWDLTGFTATGLLENHVQSYAFVLRDVTRARLRALWPVLFPWVACGGRDDVIACQETRLARVAARSMSVGAYWYLRTGDPTQVVPFDLMEVGFPFFKKSLTESRSPFPHKDRARAFIDHALNPAVSLRAGKP